jgi:hypothetical protein
MSSALWMKCARLAAPYTRSEASKARLPNAFGSGDIEWVIDQGLDAFEEAYRVWQLRVSLKRGLVLPARMHVEELRVAKRLEVLQAQAARLLARCSGDFEQGFRDGRLIAGSCMESRKDEYLQICSPSGIDVFSELANVS